MNQRGPFLLFALLLLLCSSMPHTLRAQQCEEFLGFPAQCSQMIPQANSSFLITTYPELGLTQEALVATLVATVPDFTTVLLSSECRGAIWDFSCANAFRRCQVDPFSGAAFSQPPCYSQCAALSEHCDQLTLAQLAVDCNATNPLVLQPEYPEQGWTLPLPPPAPPGVFILPCFEVVPESPVPFAVGSAGCDISADEDKQLFEEARDERGCQLHCPPPLTNTANDRNAIAITIYVISIIDLVLFPLTVLPFLLRPAGRSLVGSLVTMYLFGIFLFAWGSLIPLMMGGYENVVCQEDGSPGTVSDPPACGANAFLSISGGVLSGMYGALIAVELFVVVWGENAQRRVPPLARAAVYHLLALAWTIFWVVLPFGLGNVGATGGVQCNVSDDIYTMALIPIVIVLAVQVLFFTMVFVRIGMVLGKAGLMQNLRLICIVLFSLLVGIFGISTYVYAEETGDDYVNSLLNYASCVLTTPPLPDGTSPCSFDSPLNFGFIYSVGTFLPYFFQMCALLAILIDSANLRAYLALFTCNLDSLHAESASSTMQKDSITGNSVRSGSHSHRSTSTSA